MEVENYSIEGNIFKARDITLDVSLIYVLVKKYMNKEA